MMKLNNFLHQKYMYGGKTCKLGDIIIDLQKKAPDQAYVDKYIQGLLMSQEPIKPLDKFKKPK